MAFVIDRQRADAELRQRQLKSYMQAAKPFIDILVTIESQRGFVMEMTPGPEVEAEVARLEECGEIEPWMDLQRSTKFTTTYPPELEQTRQLALEGLRLVAKQFGLESKAAVEGDRVGDDLDVPGVSR